MFSHLKTLSSHHQLDSLEHRVVDARWWPVLGPSCSLFCGCVEKQNFGYENKTSHEKRWCKAHITSKLRSVLADDVPSGFGALFFAEPGCERPDSQCCVAIDKTRRRWAISCCVCVANHILNYIILPSYFRISSIDVLAMGSRRWMICNTCFGCCTAIDVGGRHGRSIWIFVESGEREREIQKWIRS